eukprot:563501-Prymnesium_polylepis.1
MPPLSAREPTLTQEPPRLPSPSSRAGSVCCPGRRGRARAVRCGRAGAHALRFVAGERRHCAGRRLVGSQAAFRARRVGVAAALVRRRRGRRTSAAARALRRVADSRRAVARRP